MLNKNDWEQQGETRRQKESSTSTDFENKQNPDICTNIIIGITLVSQRFYGTAQTLLKSDYNTHYFALHQLTNLQNSRFTTFYGVYSSIYRRNEALAAPVGTYRGVFLRCQWQDSKETKQHRVMGPTRLHSDLHDRFTEMQHVMTETERNTVQQHVEEIRH